MNAQQHLVMAVLARHNYRCARDGAPIRGERGVDWSLHHRRARGMGGSKATDTNSPANLLPLCGSGTTGCHGHVESHRAEALSFGWLVRQGQDPAAVPVLIEHGARLVYLDHVGGMSDDPPEVGAA